MLLQTQIINPIDAARKMHRYVKQNNRNVYEYMEWIQKY